VELWETTADVTQDDIEIIDSAEDESTNQLFHDSDVTDMQSRHRHGAVTVKCSEVVMNYTGVQRVSK